jgi:iron complex outermembrane receptor protein
LKTIKRIECSTLAMLLSIMTGTATTLIGGQVQAEQETPLELQKYAVTGTHIGRTDMEGMLPVVVMNRDEIDKSGATTINELFSKVIYNAAGIVDEKFTQGFAPASAGVDLRGMGVSRTLVLVDGRRTPLFPFGQDGSSSFVDLNLIPLGSVERVEILKEGASAIYGSDAIAGVVNIITRKEYEGVDLLASFGQSHEGDGEEGVLSITSGVSNEKGNITVGLDYMHRNKVMSKDRDISESAKGPFDDRSRAGNPGTFIAFPEGGPPPGPGPVPDSRCSPDSINLEKKGPFCLYDFGADTTLIPETDRLGLTASGNYDISNTLTFFARANYTNSDSERDLAAASGQFSVSDNPDTPEEEFLAIYRLNELGPRTDKFETEAYNLLLGLNGMVRDWEWELGVGGGKIQTDIRGTNGYATESAVQDAIDNGSLNVYGDSPDFNANATSYTTRRDGDSTIYYTDFKVVGDIITMEHGPLSAAFGIGYRNEDFSDKFDKVTESGAVLGIGGITSDGDRHSKSAFAEFTIPVLRDLEVQLAGRYDHYSDFGSTVNPKLGLRWQPRENLLLRGSAGTGFKAPTLQELYSEEIFSFESVFDPVTGEVVEVPTLASGNRKLDAEESDNFSLGVVWDVTSNWDMSLDWWKIKNEDAVTNNPQFYVNNSDLFPENVIRDSDGDIEMVFSPFQNVAAQKLWGLDFNTGVGWGTQRMGDFHFDIMATYLGSFEVEPVSGAGYDDIAGDDGRPRVRGQSKLNWYRNAFDAAVTVNYTGGYDRPDADDDIASWTTIDTQLGWQPRSLNGGKVSFGIDNIFDRDPPSDPFLEGWPFMNRALHDPRGRFFYLKYTYEFQP